MGFQITLLLTVVVYVEYLQNNIPTFSSIEETPALLRFFVILILLLTIALVTTTYTLFLYHLNSYETKNFSRTEAKISRFLAKCFSLMTCYMWKVEVPETVDEIADDPDDNIHKRFPHEDRLLGFQFLADMLNRLVFTFITLTQFISFFILVVPLYVKYPDSNENLSAEIKTFELLLLGAPNQKTGQFSDNSS